MPNTHTARELQVRLISILRQKDTVHKTSSAHAKMRKRTVSQGEQNQKLSTLKDDKHQVPMPDAEADIFTRGTKSKALNTER